MDTREIKVSCPCCESRLEIDVRTGGVLRWRPKGEKDESGKPVVGDKDWSSASERVKGRLGGAGEKFDQSLSKEKGRTEELDELFRKASEKLRRGKEES